MSNNYKLLYLDFFERVFHSLILFVFDRVEERKRKQLMSKIEM